MARIEAVELGEKLVERLLVFVVRGVAPRRLGLRPRASIPSMKTMHGAAFRACSKRSRTRAAPRPTNISTNSEPEREKNGTPASPATARASSVLPVPGGPTRSTPLGIRAPRRPNLSLLLQERHDLLQLKLGLIRSGHVIEGDAGIAFHEHTGLGFAHIDQAAKALLLGNAPE